LLITLNKYTIMARQIFINLPVKDLKRSMDFFTSLGFSFNMQFTNEKAACMVIDENIYSMLLTEAFFKTFTTKEIVDATKRTEAIIALSAGSRAEVEDLYNKAIAAGASMTREAEDHGWMYSRNFDDLDGHQWEIIFMDEAALEAQ